MTITLLAKPPLAVQVRRALNGLDFAWHDPSDLSTMFQDSAGTTPVTAVEQPVGLHLDKSRGLQLGPELVTNGTFDSDTSGWTNSGGLTVFSSVDGELHAAGTWATQTIITSPGFLYKIEFDIRLVSGTSAIVRAGIATGGSSYLNYSETSTITRHVSLYMIPTTSSTVVSIGGGSGSEGAFDNITIKLLPGYHATQSITASRPTLSARKNWLVGTETLATQNVTTVAAKYCLSFTGTGSITLSGAATGTLVGTGVSDRVWVEITPTAGTLTLTVSGSVTKAQLEFTA